MVEGGADIQVELGNWAKVHNCILEKLALAKLDGREAKCLFFLLRMTYGKQQKEHEISLSLWADGTNIGKRHVKGVLDHLLARRIIYRIDGQRGRGNTATWGFNKYFEQWDNPEKVPSTVPIKKVPSTVPFTEKKVPSTVPEKVPSTVPIIERKAEKAAAAVIEDESGDSATALVRLAYQAVVGIPPVLTSEKGRANILAAFQLIETYSYATCIRALSTLKDRQNAMFKRNSRDRIKSPLGYLRTILEEDHAVPAAIPVPTTVDFALEEIL